MEKFPRFIKDKPSGDDKFDGGSQTLLSKAIAEYILENDASDSTKENTMPRIIGIQGTWGSGKSNVVKLIEKELCADKYYFFEYDAWGNQEDLQRRSLLEQLTSDLVNNKILTGKTKVKMKDGVKEEKDWSEKLQYLLSRKTESTSESFPKLNGGIIVAALAGILTPITTLISHILDDSICWLWQFVIATLPILGALLFWSYKAIKDARYRSLSVILTIYSDKVQKEHNYEVISEDEPSVVEFKDWMRDVSNHLSSKCKKLVIVFDNMDRLPAEKVKQVWSSIHTFFAESGFDNIWVIIPYDQKHLSCAFGSEEEEKTLRLTQYFVDKTFPVTFDVPKPVITDYKGIFNKFLYQAFGDTVLENEADTINRLYRLRNPVANIREIIIFVNRLVATYKIRHKDIRLISMAVFQLYKDEISKDNTVSNILSGSYLGIASNVISNDDKLKSEISALVYGVSIDLAKQIPLTEYIKNCVDKKDGFDINQFANSDISFDSILKEVYEGTDEAYLSQLIECLDKLQKDNSTIAQLWQKLANKQLKRDIAELDVPVEYEALLRHISAEAKQHLSNKLCSQWVSIESFSGSKYVACVNKLQSLSNSTFEVKLKDKQVSPDIFMEVVNAAKDGYPAYKITCNGDVVDEYIAGKLPKEFTFAESVQVLFNDKFATFDKTWLGIKHTISTEEELDETNVGQVFNTFRLLAKSDTKLLNQFMTSHNVTALLEKLDADKKHSIKDGYIDLLAWSISNGEDVDSFNVNDEEIAQIAGIIDFYIDTDDLIINGCSNNIETLNKVVEYVIEYKLGKKLSFNKILPTYSEIRSHYSSSPESLWAFLSEWEISNTLETISDENKLKALIPSTELYSDIASITTDVTTAIKQQTVSILSNITVDKLKSTLRNYSADYWHNVIKYLIDDEAMSKMPVSIEQLAELIYRDIPNGSTTHSLNDYTKKLIAHIDLGHIASTFIEIRNDYCNDKKKITSTQFIQLEKGLRLYGNLSERVNDVISTILKRVISDSSCKDIIIKNLEFYRDLLSNANVNDDFTNAIRSSWDSTDYIKLGIKEPEQSSESNNRL